MSKVLTFSTKFPSYHPKAGQPTYFVAKIIGGLILLGHEISMPAPDMVNPKYHTIRAGHRFKAGDVFSPRVWSGKPYNSKQIVIAPDIKVEKVWDFEIKDLDWYIGKKVFGNTNEDANIMANIVAKNDGLEWEDFMDWFQYPKPFKGQIICWNPNINY